MADPNWIEHMHMDKGALHRKTGTPMGRNISPGKMTQARNSKNPTEAREAALANTLARLRK